MSRSVRPGDLFSRTVRAAKRYYLDLSPSPATELAVVCGGYEECSDHYRVERSDFPFLVLEWVVRGRGELQLAGQRHELGKGVLFSYGPGTPHVIASDPAHPMAKFFVSFTGATAPALLQRAGLAPPAASTAPRRLDLLPIFEMLRRDGESGDARAAELCPLVLHYLLVQLAVSKLPDATSGTKSHDNYLRCDQYLRENAARLTSLAELAAECQVDQTYLCHLYKRFGSESPYQRLRRLKMNIAADELLHSDHPIRDVASKLGFGDPFHFSRAFKSVFGVAPSKFRTLH